MLRVSAHDDPVRIETRSFIVENKNTVEPAYNDIGLYNTSPITLDILWYQLIRYC